MDKPALNPEIVERRQARAPELATLLQRCRDDADRLETIRSALLALSEMEPPDVRTARSEIDGLISALQQLADRVEMRHRRFAGGMVTVAIAGLEKAGKTTFLRSLTEIDALPAFDERCTAVCCEIHYDADRSDFDLEFYTESEFLDQVVRPTLETVIEALSPDRPEPVRIPESAAAFACLKLPDLTELPGGTTAHKLLRDLHRLQAHFDDCRACLGAEPLRGRPLAELSDWVAYGRVRTDVEDAASDIERAGQMARVSAAKICRIHTAFPGGSPQLRWIDTPGVDDPNRRARDLTLATVADDADLLVVASRPGANPSPAESFHHFWDSVSRLPDEVDLLSRLIFVLNWDRRVDPDGENVRIHKRYLIDAGVPSHVFAGPFEATRSEDAATLMERVNSHLAQHLSDQDDRIRSRLAAAHKTLQARIRLLHDTLRRSHPADNGLIDLENEAFHRWFHWYGDDRDNGFWPDLVAALDRSARSVADDPRIRESEAALTTIFAGEAEAIEAGLPTPADLEAHVVKHRGENPIPSGMRNISTRFSMLINRLSAEIQEFGPMIQDELVATLTEAGLGPLLQGETSAEALRSLLDGFAAVRPESPVTEVLRETLDLPRNLKYVLRYELRGAVDFCDPTLWDESESAWARLAEMVTANGGDPERLSTFSTNRHPPATDSRDKDSEILRRIAGNALVGIQAVLTNERYLPRRIADDFIRDCRVRLCFHPEAEQEWRSLLFRFRGELLGSTIAKIRARSEHIGAFLTALDRLEAGLP